MSDSPEHLAYKRAILTKALASDCSDNRLLPCPRCGNRTGVRLVCVLGRRGRRDRNQRGRCDKAAGGCGLWGRVGWGATEAERRWNDPEWRAAQRWEG